MKHEYNPQDLFDVNVDEVIYTNSNRLHSIPYNVNNSHMELIKKETPFLSFPAIDQIPYVKHGFSTRLGGGSKGCFHSLNLSFVRGDDEDAVATNYDRIVRSMGMDGMMLGFSDQVQDTVVH